jgi:uncharacterized protein
MKIWLDSTPSQHIGNDDMRDCDDDCGGDCDCAVYSFPSSHFCAPSLEEDAHTHRLQQASSLYQQRLDDEHWLLCDPIDSSQVAVVDAEALALFQQFCALTTLDALHRRNASYTLDELKSFIAIFYQLGFLQLHPRVLSNQQWGESSTLSAWLHVTNACNLRCQYCYIQKSSDHMPDDTAREAVDALFRSAQKNNFKKVRLKYAGGEASLYLSHIIGIHDYATSQAEHLGLTFGASILSNGVVLSQRSIDQLKARRIGVTISLDGIGAYHDSQRPFQHGQGSFKYVDRTLTRLLANDIKPHVTITVSQRNLPGMPDLMRYILDRQMSFTMSYYRDNDCSTHIHDLQFSDQQMIAGMREVFEVIEQNLPRRRLLNSLIDKADLSGTHTHTCGVGQNYVVIDQHGGVAKCQADIQHTITTIKADDILQKVRDDRDGVQGLAVEEKEGCKTCEWRYWCTGGCPLLTHRLTGRYDIKSPNCRIYKALFPEALRLEALRLLHYATPRTLSEFASVSI